MSYGGTFVIFSKNVNIIGIQSFKIGPLLDFEKQSFGHLPIVLALFCLFWANKGKYRQMTKNLFFNSNCGCLISMYGGTGFLNKK